MSNILIVEDERAVRENLIEILETSGYTCKEATNGFEALELLKKFKPDLILSDIMMPGLDGLEFYEKVRSELFDQSVPFLFLTAKMDYSTKEKAMGLGAEGFLTKPFKVSELLNRIKVRLEKKKKVDEKFDRLKMDISLYVPHELKTPLIPVLGFSQMLIEDYYNYSDEEKLEMLNAIHKGALRFKERVEKFTVYSELKIEENEKNIVSKEIFDLKDLNVKEKLKEKFHCIDRFDDIRCEIEPCQFIFPKTHFEALIFELAENACKFSPPKTPISISGKNYDSEYWLNIKSIGDKIEPELFEEFYQKERDKYQQIGNGLGLSIVKLIVSRYQLKMHFDYDEKNRNSITIKFPKFLIN